MFKGVIRFVTHIFRALPSFFHGFWGLLGYEINSCFRGNQVLTQTLATVSVCSEWKSKILCEAWYDDRVRWVQSGPRAVRYKINGDIGETTPINGPCS